MSKWNAYMGSHFDGCLLLATTYDRCRNRAVRVYALPGEFDYVGVADGTDAWIAPVAIDPFSCGIVRIMADLRAGKAPTAAQSAPRQRMRVQLPEQLPLLIEPPAEQPKKGRVRVTAI